MLVFFQQSHDIQATSLSNNYTTSSGRIVKNPNNYAITGMNALQSQKRVRIGAVTRSLISSGSNANGSINIVETRHPEGTNPPKLVQNIENLTTAQILPAAPHEPEHFFKVLIFFRKNVHELNVI